MRLICATTARVFCLTPQRAFGPAVNHRFPLASCCLLSCRAVDVVFDFSDALIVRQARAHFSEITMSKQCAHPQLQTLSGSLHSVRIDVFKATSSQHRNHILRAGTPRTVVHRGACLRNAWHVLGACRSRGSPTCNKTATLSRSPCSLACNPCNNEQSAKICHNHR